MILTKLNLLLQKKGGAVYVLYDLRLENEGNTAVAIEMAKPLYGTVEVTCYIMCYNVLQSYQGCCATSWPLETASRQHGAEDQTG